MQIVSLGDNLHEISIPIFIQKSEKNKLELLSAELAQRMLKVKRIVPILFHKSIHFEIS